MHRQYLRKSVSSELVESDRTLVSPRAEAEASSKYLPHMSIGQVEWYICLSWSFRPRVQEDKRQTLANDVIPSADGLCSVLSSHGSSGKACFLTSEWVGWVSHRLEMIWLALCCTDFAVNESLSFVVIITFVNQNLIAASLGVRRWFSSIIKRNA